MATVQESIDVNVPLSQAYNQWTQFEDFPQFMSGVDAVQQLNDTTVHFQTSVGGVKREYDARISSQDPDRQVAWESLESPRNAGTVRFTELGPASTRVDVELSWEPDSAAEKVGAAVGLDSRQVAADLQRFKKFIEGRDFETGAWRERVSSGVDGEASSRPLLTDPGYDVVGPGATANTDPDLATEPAFDGGESDGTASADRDRRASDR
ncbi:SRPBCC family protein [Arthrobacter sp. B3I4]|uniref:SRPBCC family protein n=1 Tax=Arthrobacter sp. B3I4 TaxID=3042267 RepID=UPI00278B5A3D|nr:SRPBCC family protein [Arthrobacter sp. B3I4]MDQ0757255.1 putative membrane protein [Arthrobacter sp. B3I4]